MDSTLLICISILIAVAIIPTWYYDYKTRKLLEDMESYRKKYFDEQKLSEIYRACLYIAITDMKDNGWYKSYAEAFNMLQCRINPYKFSKEFDFLNLVSRMLYWGKSVKFSYDLEQELLDEEKKD